jgi:Predicted integral membrane protein
MFMPFDNNIRMEGGNLYKPSENFKIREHGRQITRGRLWFVWQQILIISVISAVASYILDFVCGSPLDSFAAESVPREYNSTGYSIYSILMFVVSLALAPMTYGLSRNCSLAVRGNEPDRTTVALFQKYKDWNTFIKTVGIYALSAVKVFLWSLLLIVPGILKAISYALVPYLAFDEPELSIKETLRKSEDMMRGFRGKFFLLMLTFLGWQIVSAFTFFILDIWLMPYMMFTVAAFYDEMRRCFYGGNDPARNEDATPEEGSRPPFDGRFADDETTSESHANEPSAFDASRAPDILSTPDVSRPPDEVSPAEKSTNDLKF